MLLTLCIVFVGLGSVLTASIEDNPSTAPKAPSNCTDKIERLERQVRHLDSLVSYAYMAPSVPTVNCTLTRFTFLRVQQTQDYVRYRGYFPRMTSGTICAWIKVNEWPNDFATILSYWTSSKSDLFIYRIKPPNILGLNIHNSWADDFILKQPNELNHICTWFDSGRKVIGTFVNGEEYPPVGYSGVIIDGGGSALIGQEQDAYNAGNRDPNQSLSGTIDNFMIWPRVLSHVEVLRMAGMCQCPVDHAVVLTNDRIELWGETSYTVPTECPMLTV